VIIISLTASFVKLESFAARPDYAELWTSGHPTPPTQPLSASYMDMKGRQPPLQQVTAVSIILFIYYHIFVAAFIILKKIFLQ